MNRKDFATRFIILIVISQLFQMLLDFVVASYMETAPQLVFAVSIIVIIVAFLSLVYFISIMVRRARDIGRKWYYVLLILIPFVNLAVVLHLLLAKSKIVTDKSKD